MADSDTKVCTWSDNAFADEDHPSIHLATNTSKATKIEGGRDCKPSSPAKLKPPRARRNGGRNITPRCRVPPCPAPKPVEDEGCSVPSNSIRKPIEHGGCRFPPSPTPEPVEDEEDSEVTTLAFSLVQEVSEVNTASSETARSHDSPLAAISLQQSPEPEPCNASPRSHTSQSASTSSSFATQVLSRDASSTRSKSPSKRLSSAQDHGRSNASKRAKVTDEVVLGDNFPSAKTANLTNDHTKMFEASLPERPRQCASLQQLCLETNEILGNLKRELIVMDSKCRSECSKILAEIRRPIFDLPTVEKTVHVLKTLRSAAEKQYSEQREQIERLRADNVIRERVIENVSRALDDLLDVSWASSGTGNPTQLEEDYMSTDGSTLVNTEGEDMYTKDAAADMEENNESLLGNTVDGNGAVIPELVVTEPNDEGKRGSNVTTNWKTSDTPVSIAALKDILFNRTAIPGAVILAASDKDKTLRLRRMDDVPSTTVEASGIDRLPRTHHVSFIVGYLQILEPVWMGPSNEPKALGAIVLANEQIKATHPNCLEVAQKQFSCLACLNFGKECESSSKDGMRIACDCCRGKGTPCIVGRQGRFVVLPQSCRLSV